ncbi:unnamed protein product [Durusdinium trenchii]|uniref:Calmodulin n=1 Tax=Durusdinium trenchii TaxID=1381693 RepID=A0ABP0N6X0_9DINO
MAAPKSAIKSRSEPSFSISVPSCAEPSESVRWELQRKDALQTRYRLKKKERERLDFHGLAGDVRGFTAFLTHRYGSICRGWRTGVAPDEMGLAPVLQSDFFMAMHKMGFTGNVLSLWKELTHGAKESCWLGDIDHKLQRGLDQLAAGLFKSYKGGARQAWEEVPKAWASRMNYAEREAPKAVSLFSLPVGARSQLEKRTDPRFVQWMEEQAITRPRGFAVSERCLFDALDIKGVGTVTVEDFCFLDHWAHKRLKKPLPVQETATTSRWDTVSQPLPPMVKSPKKQTIKDFRSYLETQFGGPGGAGRAWRVAMDVKGRGALTLGEFGSACRAVGWKSDHVELFRLLKAAGQGLVRFRALDPETAEALVKFKDEAESKCRGPVLDFWAQVMDPGDAGAMSRSEFLKDLPKVLGMAPETLLRVFNTLDPTNTGWLAATELQYLETFEMGLADFMADQEHQAPLLLAGPASNAEPVLPTGVLGDFKVPWQVTNRKVLSEADLLVSPLGRQLWAPHRSSRSFQQRALENSHMLKHRWLNETVEDRCLYKNFEPVQTMRSDHSRVFRKKRKDFIFRTSHEFYRKGVNRFRRGEVEPNPLPPDPLGLGFS